MAILNYQALKFQNGTVQAVNDLLTVEEAIQININNTPFTVTMRTPGNEAELVRGLLYTENIYTSQEIPLVFDKVEKNRAGVITKIYLKLNFSHLKPELLNNRNLLSVSSCGICGKRQLEDLVIKGEPLQYDNLPPLELISAMFKTMDMAQTTFKQSGGSHAAAAFSHNGEMLTVMEDIGRHNAVDKVVGSLLNTQSLKRAKCLLVSGRISYEIVSKAYTAGIPILAAVSAPSSMAVDYAEQLGLIMLGFCRDSNATVYSNYAKLINTEKQKLELKC